MAKWNIYLALCIQAYGGITPTQMLSGKMQVLIPVNTFRCNDSDHYWQCFDCISYVIVFTIGVLLYIFDRYHLLEINAKQHIFMIQQNIQYHFPTKVMDTFWCINLLTLVLKTKIYEIETGAKEWKESKKQLS